MSWVRNRFRPRHIAAAALLAVGAASAAANVMVVRSSGPSAKSYPAGRSLPDNARLTLQSGDTVVVLVGGGTRTLRGPGTFSPTGPVTAAQRTLTTAGGTRLARVGAVREAASSEQPPTLWHVDVSRSTTFCLPRGTEPTLWRLDPSEAVTVSIAGTGAPARTVEWSAGQRTLAWPADLAPAENAEYRLSWAGADEPTRLRFRLLPAAPGDAEAMASALISNQCEAQLDQFIEAMQRSEAASGRDG